MVHRCQGCRFQGCRPTVLRCPGCRPTVLRCLGCRPVGLGRQLVVHRCQGCRPTVLRCLGFPPTALACQPLSGSRFRRSRFSPDRDPRQFRHNRFLARRQRCTRQEPPTARVRAFHPRGLPLRRPLSSTNKVLARRCHPAAPPSRPDRSRSRSHRGRSLRRRGTGARTPHRNHRRTRHRATRLRKILSAIPGRRTPREARTAGRNPGNRRNPHGWCYPPLGSTNHRHVRGRVASALRESGDASMQDRWKRKARRLGGCVDRAEFCADRVGGPRFRLL
jgi:hypothetical protein